MDMNKYYGQLVGCKIQDFHFEEGTFKYDNPFPVFTLTNGSEKVRFVISQDEEGNGGGFAFIEDK
jgi:hypothetical protein